jgi:hypothetical protein
VVLNRIPTNEAWHHLSFTRTISDGTAPNRCPVLISVAGPRPPVSASRTTHDRISAERSGLRSFSAHEGRFRSALRISSLPSIGKRAWHAVCKQSKTNDARLRICS